MPLSKEKEAEAKRQIPSDVEQYLANGGAIKQIKMGESTVFQEQKDRLKSAINGANRAAQERRRLNKSKKKVK